MMIPAFLSINALPPGWVKKGLCKSETYIRLKTGMPVWKE